MEFLALSRQENHVANVIANGDRRDDIYQFSGQPQRRIHDRERRTGRCALIELGWSGTSNRGHSHRYFAALTSFPQLDAHRRHWFVGDKGILGPRYSGRFVMKVQGGGARNGTTVAASFSQMAVAMTSSGPLSPHLLINFIQILLSTTKHGDIIGFSNGPPKMSVYWTSSHCSSFSLPPKDFTFPCFSNLFMCNLTPFAAASNNESG